MGSMVDCAFPTHQPSQVHPEALLKQHPFQPISLRLDTQQNTTGRLRSQVSYPRNQFPASEPQVSILLTCNFQVQHQYLEIQASGIKILVLTQLSYFSPKIFI